MASTFNDRVDGISVTVAIKAPVVAATTEDITLSADQTIDGVAVVSDDRVLVKDQDTGSENGIYVVASGAWSRAEDLDGARDLTNGTQVRVTGGTANKGIWECTTSGTIVIDTTSLTFALLDNELAGVSAFMDTVLDDASAADARTTLGAGTSSGGKETIWVPAAAMRPTVSNGCAGIADSETTSGRPDIQHLAFDTGSDEHAQFQIAMPKSWDEGTVTFQAFWTGIAAGAGGVAWALQGVSAANDATLDVAYGTAVVVTDTLLAVEDNHVTAESAAITIAGTPAEDDLVTFRVFRDVSDGSDTRAADANLIGIKLFFTSDAQYDG